MRVVVQRVKKAAVKVNQQLKGKIDKGLLIFLGVEKGDGEKDLEYLVEKTANLRIFEDEDEKMNLSIQDIKGSILVVSQFTLCGDCRKGRRPSFSQAEQQETAKIYYERFVESLRKMGIPTETGVFQAHMDVELINDGPVTLLLDSKKNF
jgi:D-tyrosyl-tRNA(Tyr) deacylase